MSRYKFNILAIGDVGKTDFKAAYRAIRYATSRPILNPWEFRNFVQENTQSDVEQFISDKISATFIVLPNLKWVKDLRLEAAYLRRLITFSIADHDVLLVYRTKQGIIKFYDIDEDTWTRDCTIKGVAGSFDAITHTSFSTEEMNEANIDYQNLCNEIESWGVPRYGITSGIIYEGSVLDHASDNSPKIGVEDRTSDSRLLILLA